MNTNRDMQREQILQERLGLRLAAHLAAGASELPHEVQERLRAARVQAVARRRRGPARVAPRAVAAAAEVVGAGGAALLRGGERFDRIGRMATAALLAALGIGLMLVVNLQDEDGAREAARVDQALLTDDLPPQAYTDPGFLQFLKTRGDVPSTTPR